VEQSRHYLSDLHWLTNTSFVRSCNIVVVFFLFLQQYGDIFNSAFILIDNPDIASEIDSLLYTCSTHTSIDVSSLKDILRVLLIIAKGNLFNDTVLKKVTACLMLIC